MINCKTCGTPITNSRNEKYCSFECVGKSQLKYTDEVREFVADNIKTMKIKSIAKELNVKESGLRVKITQWRKAGYDIGGSTGKHFSRH